ncbi:MAG TPA: Sec-independent protein translocase protein TatB [Thauera aminoaromatica]|nr:Sec-independent protein translocase protein TatB [Thauera aminoaromatica]
MFDVGLSELMVIGVVALIVIGPERLPRVARTAGHLLGRLQRYVSDVKADINREMQLEELKKLQQQVASQVSSIESTVSHEMREVEQSVGAAVAPASTEAAPAAADAATAPAPAATTEALAAPAQAGDATKT